MSNFSGYPTRSFSESQKFFVLDPNTGSPSFVLGSDLVDQITPNSNYVYSESTRTTAQATDYAIGSLVQTAGATSAGDNFAAVYLVVAAGEGDFPMDNGNELLVIRGDEFLREQLTQNTVGDGSDLVAHTGTSDTVTEALDKRAVFVESVATLRSSSFPASLKRLWLSGYYGVGTPGGGELYADHADSSTADNGGAVFVDADGVRWKRNIDFVYANDFGARGNDSKNNDSAIANAIQYAEDNNFEEVLFLDGVYQFTGISYSFLQNIVIKGAGRRNTTLKYVGVSGGDAMFLSGFAYGGVKDIGIDGNLTAKNGLVVHDDDNATSGVTINNRFKNIFLKNFTDASGHPLKITSDTSFQVSENTYEDIYGLNCYNGILIEKNQTIMNVIDGLIFKQMQGGSFITIRGGFSNSIRNFHCAGNFDDTIRIVSSNDGLKAKFESGYFEQGGGTFLKMENAQTLPIGSIIIDDIDLAWSGETASDKIIDQQFGSLDATGLTIRTPSSSSAGTLSSVHSGEGSGGRCRIELNYRVTGPGESNITTSLGQSFYNLNRDSGNIEISNRNTIGPDGGDFDTQPIRIDRPSAFGSQRGNGLGFATNGTVDGILTSSAAKTGYFAAALRDQTELLEFGGSSSAGEVRRIGASGSNGYQQPFYLGNYALWVDSNGSLRIKNGTPTNDTDGTVVGSQS